MVSSVEQIPFPDFDKLTSDHANHFKVGDVVFARRTGYTGERIDELIYLAQKVISFVKELFGIKSSTFSDALHVSIVVKVEGSRVLVADAMPTKGYNLRIAPFWIQNDIRLKKGEPYKYEVFRFEDQEIAKNAAEIAARLSCPTSNLGGDFKEVREEREAATYRNRYSFWAGFKAIVLGNHKLGKHGKERAYRGLFDEATTASVSSGRRKRGKNFYCSHFVAHAYQQAEMGRIFRKQEFYVPVTYSNQSEAEQREVGIKWAKGMSKCKGEGLTPHLKHFKIDVKYMSPQDFRQLVENNSLFTHAVDIVPPS